MNSKNVSMHAKNTVRVLTQRRANSLVAVVNVSFALFATTAKLSLDVPAQVTFVDFKKRFADKVKQEHIQNSTYWFKKDDIVIDNDDTLREVLHSAEDSKVSFKVESGTFTHSVALSYQPQTRLNIPR